jgi:Uma2 family endonuclease
MRSAIDHPVVDFESIDTSRYEQIDGLLRERPMPKDRHSEVQGNIIEILGPKARAMGLRVYPELSVDREDTPHSDWMTPDVVVAQPDFTRTERRNALPPLLLVIEILSPEQTVPEMIRKAQRYLDWGVNNVWLIEPHKQFALALLGGSVQSQPALVWSGFNLQLENGLSIPLADLLA